MPYFGLCNETVLILKNKFMAADYQILCCIQDKCKQASAPMGSLFPVISCLKGGK